MRGADTRGAVGMVKMGTVWERTAEFVTDNLPAILPVALFAFFVPFSLQRSLGQVWSNASPELAMTLALMMLAFVPLSLWGWLVLLSMGIGHDARQTAGGIALRRLFPVLVVWIGVFLVIFVLPVVLIFVVAGGAEQAVRGLGDAAGGSLDAQAMARQGTMLYAALLALPLLWIGARLIVVTPVILNEGRFFGAIARSFSLTRHYTLAIVGVLLLYFLVSQVAALATNVVFGSIFRLIAGGPDEGFSLSNILTSVMVAAVQAGFQVIGAIFSAKLYLALIAERARAAVPA